MVAVAAPRGFTPRQVELSPYLAEAPARTRRAVSRAMRLRRLRALVLLAGLVFAVRTMPGGPGSAPLSAPEPARASAAASAPAPARVHIVQPGDTLWSIARALQPTGEVRPLVDRLAAQRQGRPLRVGERLSLPE